MRLPSTDTAVSNAPANKVGEASGLYKMASSLGGSFGVAISAAVYEALSAGGNVSLGATGGIITNVIFGILALLSVMFMVPGNAGKGGPTRKSPAPTYFKIEKKHGLRQRATE